MNMNALKKAINRTSKFIAHIFVPKILSRRQYLFAAFLGGILVSGQAWSDVNGGGKLDTIFSGTIPKRLASAWNPASCLMA